MNKGICPLCGNENKCHFVRKLDPANCWCMTTKVPKELLDRVPQEKKGESCICEDCIKKYYKEL